jgi:hypothetical protein
MLAVAATGSLRLTALLVVAATCLLGSLLRRLLVVTTTRLLGGAAAATTLSLRGGYRQLGNLLTAQDNLLLLTLTKPIPVLAGAVTTTARSGTTKGKTFCKRIRTAHFIKRSREFLRMSGWTHEILMRST